MERNAFEVCTVKPLTMHKLGCTLELVSLVEPYETAIVLTRTRSDTDFLGARMREAGMMAASIHSGVSHPDRASIWDRFRTLEVNIICATPQFLLFKGVPRVNVVIDVDARLTIESDWERDVKKEVLGQVLRRNGQLIEVIEADQYSD